MTRRAIAAVGALVVLGVLGGCLGLGGGDDQVGPATFDGSSLDEHRQALVSADTYTVVRTDSGGVATEQTIRVDRAENVVRQEIRAHGIEQVSYVTSARTYTRARNTEGTVQYNVSGRPARPPGERTVADLLPDDVGFERVGTTTVDGTRVATFEDVYSADVGPTRTPPGDRSDAFSATVFVRDDGLVKRLNVTRETGLTRVQTTLTFTDLGSTTVREPDWLDEARQAD